MPPRYAMVLCRGKRTLAEHITNPPTSLSEPAGVNIVTFEQLCREDINNQRTAKVHVLFPVWKGRAAKYVGLG